MRRCKKDISILSSFKIVFICKQMFQLRRIVWLPCAKYCLEFVLIFLPSLKQIKTTTFNNFETYLQNIFFFFRSCTSRVRPFVTNTCCKSEGARVRFKNVPTIFYRNYMHICRVELLLNHDECLLYEVGKTMLFRRGLMSQWDKKKEDCRYILKW